MMKEPDRLARIAAQMRGKVSAGRGRYSALFRWMDENFDDFGRFLAEQRPSWDAVAKGLSDLKTGNGKAPDAERARKTWEKVRAARRKNAALPATQKAVGNGIPSPAPERAAGPATRPARQQEAQQDLIDEPDMATDDEAEERRARLLQRWNVGARK